MGRRGVAGRFRAIRPSLGMTTAGKPAASSRSPDGAPGVYRLRDEPVHVAVQRSSPM